MRDPFGLAELDPQPFAVSPPPRGRFIDLGSVVCRWIEANLVHGEGDYYGQPFRLDPFERWFIRRLYLIDADTMRRLVRRALLVLPKGNGKTEVIAAVCLAELAGPVMVDRDGRPRHRPSPNIPIAAASYDQAGRLFGAAADMAGHRDSPLRGFVDVFESEIKFRDRDTPGVLFRVAAVAGTNDGGLPTAAGFDEIHEWDGRKERVHIVIGNSLAKRDQALELNISTPDDAQPDSLFGRLHAHGMRVASGEVDDPSFLFAWWSAPKDVDIDDPDALRAAIRQSNPGSWIDPERIAARYEVDRIPPHEFRRYHLAQLVRAAESFLPEGAWEARAGDRGAPPEGETVVLAFDGSLARDTTAIVGATLDGHVFVVDAWERPMRAPADWKVPRSEVDAAMERAFHRWKVRELACDPAWWPGEFQDWAYRYGEERVVEFPNTHNRMGPACSRFYAAVTAPDDDPDAEPISHDDDPRLARHLANAVLKDTRHGAVIVKETRDSPRKIDLAVAAVMAYDRAMWHRANHPKRAVAMVLGGPDKEGDES